MICGIKNRNRSEKRKMGKKKKKSYNKKEQKLVVSIVIIVILLLLGALGVNSNVLNQISEISGLNITFENQVTNNETTQENTSRTNK